MTQPTIKLKVRRKSVVKGKALVKFPANVEASEFITVDKLNGTYTFGADFNLLAQGTPTALSTSFTAVLDQAQGVYKLVALSDIGGAGGAPGGSNGQIQINNSGSFGGITTGTGVTTALGVNVGSVGAFVLNGGALGTPSSGNGSNLSSLNASNISSGTLADARTSYTSAGTGAVARTVGNKLSDTVYVEDFGAVGNGVTDDAPAIRAAAAYVGSLANGGRILYRNKTYLLGSLDSGTNRAIIRQYSNVTHEGQGEATVLKAAAGLNTVSQQFAFFYPPDETNTYTYSNIHIRNIKFDANGANNLTGGPYQNIAFGVRFGSLFSVENCTFVNFPGYQVVSFGDNPAIQVSQIQVSGNTFVNCGYPTNASLTDHSSIYVVGSHYEIYSNRFYCSSQDIYGTAIEMHGTNGSAFGNSVFNYARAINIASQLNHAGSNLSFVNNTILNAQSVLRVYFDGTAEGKNIVVANNIFRQSVQHATFPFIDFDTSVSATGLKNVVFANNVISSDVAGGVASTIPLLKLGRAANIKLTNNTFNGGNGPAIGGGTFDTSTSIEIRQNTIVDCGQSSTAAAQRGVLISTATTLKSLIISGNRVANVAGTYMTTGIDLASTNVSLGYIEPNNRIESVANGVTVGGTGFWPTTAFGVSYSLGQGLPMTSTAAMTNGQLLIGQTGAAPSPLSVSGDATLSAAGALTLSLPALSSYTPTVTSGGGTITTVGTVTSYYRQIGKMLYVDLIINITTAGTATNNMIVTLPNSLTAAHDTALCGNEILVTGKALKAYLLAGGGGNQVQVRYYDNTSVFADGTRFLISGWVEVS